MKWHCHITKSNWAALFCLFARLASIWSETKSIWEYKYNTELMTADPVQECFTIRLYTEGRKHLQLIELLLEVIAVFYTSERRRDSPLKKVIAGYLQFYISPGKRLGRFKGHFLAQIRFYFLLKVVLNPLCGENWQKCYYSVYKWTQNKTIISYAHLKYYD